MLPARQTRSVVSGPEPSHGGGANVGWTRFEDNETLLAMDDETFKRAVTRQMASQRKIYSVQQKNWASVRLKLNAGATKRGAALLRARIEEDGAAVTGPIRDRCKALTLAASLRTGQAPHASSSSGASALKSKLVGVTSKLFRAAANGGNVEERQQVKAVALPLTENVPRYTSYMYAAYENSHVQDEVGRCTTSTLTQHVIQSDPFEGKKKRKEKKGCMSLDASRICFLTHDMFLKSKKTHLKKSLPRSGVHQPATGPTR